MSGKVSEKCDRKVWIDMLKGFGILLVLIGHSHCPKMFDKFIYGFHMPLFFILSGYLFNDTYYKKSNIKSYVRKKWNAYIIPYFVLSLCNLIITLIIKLLAKVSLNDLVRLVYKYLFFIIYSFGDASKMPNCSPLWFLPCLFIAYIYLFIFIRFNNKIKCMTLIIGVFIILFLVNLNITQLPWHFDIAFIGMIFMYIGIFLRRLNITMVVKTKKIMFVGMAGILSILFNDRADMVWRQFGNLFLFFIGATCIVILLICLFTKLTDNSFGGRLISYIGRNSMYYMGFNLLINCCINIIDKRTFNINAFTYGWIVYVIINLVTIAIGIIVLKKLKSKLNNYLMKYQHYQC